MSISPLFFVGAIFAQIVLALNVSIGQERGNIIPGQPAPYDYVWGSLIAQAVILITTLAGIGYNIYRDRQKAKAEDKRREDEEKAKAAQREYDLKREEMKRKWDLEDRARARQEALEKLEEVKSEARATRDTLAQKIDENTAINEQAIAEANDANRKILEMQQMFLGAEKGLSDVTDGRADDDERIDADAAREAASRHPNGLRESDR